MANRARENPDIKRQALIPALEVDILLENPVGEVVGIEVKASSTVKAHDFKGLKYLSDLLGKRFLRGIVLYTGDQPVPFGSNLYALPVSALWRSSAMPHENSKDKL